MSDCETMLISKSGEAKKCSVDNKKQHFHCEYSVDGCHFYSYNKKEITDHLQVCEIKKIKPMFATLVNRIKFQESIIELLYLKMKKMCNDPKDLKELDLILEILHN